MDSLIYIAPQRSSFVLQDIESLNKHTAVTAYFFNVKYKVLLPWYLARLFLFLLFSDRQTFLISFGGFHSFVATLVAKLKQTKSFIILNGVDSANIPEFEYGHLRGGLIKWCCKKSYLWATMLLPVSESLMDTTTEYGFDQPKRLGLKNEFPESEFTYQVIPNGFDTAFWLSVSEKEKRSFLTVVGSKKRIALKGLDLILEIAPEFPDCTFYVVGLDSLESAPTNVKALGYLNAEELRVAYSKAQFYVQLSVWEGFGCALCEAMLCGCIPIGSNVNMIPEIVGDTGFIARQRAPDRVEETFRVALNSDSIEVMSKNARLRVTEQFGITKRIHNLLECVVPGY